MRAIDIRVSHDDDSVITELVRVELVLADATAKRGHYGADFGRAKHLIEAGFLDIKDLTLERQDSLKLTITTLLG